MGLFKKAALRAALCAARYSQRLKEDLIKLESLILDEIYTFSGSKNQRCYVFTAVGATELGKRYFFARVLDEPSSVSGEREHNSRSPELDEPLKPVCLVQRDLKHGFRAKWPYPQRPADLSEYS